MEPAAVRAPTMPGLLPVSATSSVQPRSVADSFSKIENPSSHGSMALGIGAGNRLCGFGHRPVECRVEQRLSRPGHEVDCFVTGELSDIG